MSSKVLRAKWGSPDKPLVIGNLEIPCYVLEDGTRVLSGRGMQGALALGQSHGALLRGFLDKSNLTPFIHNELAMALSNPIRFIRPGRGGKLAVGYEATILVDLCDAVLDARDAGVLKGKQLFVAKQCEMLTRAFAKVGIVALVDEATGYDAIRDRMALQAILERYLTDEWAKWTKTFPDEFYIQLFRLKGIDYPPLSMAKPSYVGHWTNDVVYSRLAPGVLSELKRKNPRLASGRRARMHHQYLTRDIGHPTLREHLMKVIFLMRGCSTWDEFRRMLNRASPRYGDTLPIEFDELRR